MPERETLIEVLRHFSDPPTDPADPIAVLDHLCDHLLQVFDATAAGVALRGDDGRLRYATATDDAAVAVEAAQERSQAGPCHESLGNRRPLPVPDVRAVQDRWPDFCRTAAGQGLTSVVGLPLLLGGEPLGSIDVYDTGTRPWSDEEVSTATVLVAIAAAQVFSARELARSRRMSEQLQHALHSRVVIEQAKGKLAGLAGLPVDDAFDIMRRHARSNRLSLRDVAQAIVDDGIDVVASGMPTRIVSRS